MKYVFIVNPISGGSSKAKLIQYLNEFCFSNQLDFEIRNTSYAGHAKEIALEYFNAENTLVVAVGGDGTVNEVASSLMGAKACFHVIPCGSGNGFARHHQVSLDVIENCRQMIAAGGNHYLVDAGFVNEQPFFNVSGIGFDAYISDKFSQLKGRGFANYIKAVINHYGKARNTGFKLRVNEQEIIHKAFFVSFANTSQFGNNVYIAPEASSTDGLIDIVVVSKIPVYLFPIIAYKLFKRLKVTSKYVKYYRAAEVGVFCEAQQIHIDGEPVAGVYDQIVVKVSKAALKMLKIRDILV